MIATTIVALAASSAFAHADDALPPGPVGRSELGSSAGPAPSVAIPGYYDPVAKQFRPDVSPAAQTKTYQLAFDISVTVISETWGAIDWGHPPCKATISYRGPNSQMTRTASIEQRPQGGHATVRQLITTSGEADPRGSISVECRVFFWLVYGYATTQTQSFAIANGTVTLPLTFYVP
jgi:hypothetical protein